MAKDTQVLRSGNLFSMIIQTNLSTAPLTQVKLKSKEDIKIISPTTSASGDTPVMQEDSTEIKLDDFVYDGAEQSNKEQIKIVKVKENSASNTVTIGNNNKDIFDVNEFKEKKLKYTIENANTRYKEIIGIDPTEPFTFLSSATDYQFYKSKSTDNDPYYKTTFKFDFGDDGVNNVKEIVVPVFYKMNVSNWKIPFNPGVNLKKLENFLNNDNNKKNFRRIVKIMAALLVRESGYLKDRYKGNPALMQLEYSIVCWCLINYVTKRGSDFIAALINSQHILNKSKNEEEKLIKNLRPEETEEEMLRRESQNLKKYKDQSGTQNLELYVMAFFAGLINEELPGYTNWDHVGGGPGSRGENPDFKIRNFQLPAKETIENITYPRMATDADTANSTWPEKITLSGSRIYGLVDAQNKLNAIFAKN